ncbi:MULTISPECIES: hypothetical protein [Nostocales]|uniref:Secreted protein n=3 Tax=Nostocales TaxID=1161 RepID=A0A0C1N8D7_9CYAN|nr:hypothetical protein [Tolypothrix bouteillei]KAF3886947.1 hypothetical protein DA73_0400016730 [Tolypothrix bouteillei VB521301]
MINRIRTAIVGMSILATALVSTTATAIQPQAEVVSQNCTDAVRFAKYTLASSRPAQPSSNLPIAAPQEGPTEKKTCETTNSPGTNKQGENGTNRCTTCTYSSNGHVTVNCIFIKTKNPGSPQN